MKNTMKNIAVVLTAASLVLGCGLFTACDTTPPPDGEPTDYTVTVLNPYGIAVDDVEVHFGSSETVSTNDNGKATATLNAGNYKITLDNLPDVYTYNAVNATADSTDIKIDLKLKDSLAEGELLYTVKVVLEDGTPVAGEYTSLCVPMDAAGGGGACYNSDGPTNERGETYKALPAGIYEAKIIGAGSMNYTFEKNDEGYYVELANSDYPMVIMRVKRV